MTIGSSTKSGSVHPTGFLRAVAREVGNTLRRPQRLLKLLSPKAIREYLRFQGTVIRSGEFAQGADDDGFSTRPFDAYEDYVELQKMKLDYVDLEEHEKRFRQKLRERLEELPCVAPGKNALCLAARLGGEVRAFIDAGCFAVGIDLNPGKDNRHVLPGDFHDIQWPDRSVDLVYTNSVDHAFAIDKLLAEILRVLKPDGAFILEADPGTEDEGGINPDTWATLSWQRVDDLVDRFARAGFTVVSRRRFDYPRGGEQIVFAPRS